MPERYNHSIRRRSSRRDDEPFEAPQPVFNPMAGFPRVLLPRGWKLRATPNRTARIILSAMTLPALILLLAALLAAVFGAPR